MAEWRSRGYVADSDEEEESQTSLHKVDVTLHTARLGNDDTEIDNALIPKGGWKAGDGEISASKVGGEASSSGLSGKEEKDIDVPRPLGLNGQANPLMRSGEADSHSSGRLSSHDYGDIDELQEGHYKDASAAQLEAEPVQGAHELASPARPTAPSHLRRLLSMSSSTSSPSDLREAPYEASLLTHEERSIQGEPVVHDNSERWDASSPPSLALPATAASVSVESSRETRTLRHRNPIQLHPYAIESEKYKQTLQARGVKPLRIAQMEAEAASVRQKEFQNVEYRAEDSQEAGRISDQDNLGSSSPFQSQSPPTSLAENAKDIFVFGDDDELPDMNTLLRNPVHEYKGSGYKRRKIASASFRMPPRMRQAIRKPSVEHSTHSLNDDDDIMFDAPPSPPHSGSQTPLNIRPESPPSRPFRQSAQAALPTPVTSSEPRRRQDLAVSEGESDDAPSYSRSRTVILSDKSETDEASSEKESSHHLQRVQRRIRGVLPASWLKLDLKARQKKPHELERPHHSLSPERTSMQRGVARPFTKTLDSQAAHNHNEAYLLSDDEGSASDQGSVQRRLYREPQISFGQGDDEGFFRDRWGEAAENDRVDAMLPSVERSRHKRKTEKKKGKRQTKMADFESHARLLAHGSSEALQRHHPHQPRMTEGFDEFHAKKPKFRPPNLSILDAPSLESTSHNIVPRFLKVATRAARSRNDRGRHSPSRKYVRLATKEDDQDASETLRNWREGTIAPSTKYKSRTRSDRRPLTSRSTNNALAPRASHLLKDHHRSIETTSRSNVQRSPYHSGRRRKFQSSLDHLVQRQSKERPPSEDLNRQRGGKPRKRGQLVSSIRTNDDSRPAMLEISKEGGGELHAQAVFQRDLSRINRFDDESGLPNVLRLFADDIRQSRDHPLAHPTKSKSNPGRNVAHRGRKRRPHQVDVSSPWSTHTSAPVVLDDLPDATTSQDVIEYLGRDVVAGLGPFGTRYSDTLGIGALPIGTCFHESTFIGSGSFARSLRLESQVNLDSFRGYALLQVGKTYRWGPWNDTVSSELGELLAWIYQATENRLAEDQQPPSSTPDELAVSALKSIIVYFSNHLSFLDPVDRLSCIQRCKTLMANLSLEPDVCRISRAADATKPMKDPCVTRLIQMGAMKLVWANQVRQLSRHELVPPHLQDEVRSLVQTTTRQMVSLATKEGLSEFKTCISNSKRSDAAGDPFQNHQKSIEAFIVAQHVLRQDTDSLVDLWNAVEFIVPAKTPNGVFDIGQAEDSWRQLFTLLPFLELDANGIIDIGRRFNTPFENWPLIKRLIAPVLEASLTNPRGQAPSFNAYCRAIFGRCLHLVNGWGWRRCESIIGTLFDFFARNDLAHLRNEESHGSPLFLEHLAQRPSLTVQPEDRCFHILLKIIGSGIRHMRSFYTDKKIRDLVWRLMPNHGRSHPKEEAIRQEDLDALRNHHDLLCTLYWASPSSCRPRPTVIRDLVHLESSHREACHINVRAWSNLVIYQLSTDEKVSNLQPFAEWHDDLLVQLLRQHSLARTEAEDQARSIQRTGGLSISDELLESTIARNQRQVEAILIDALVSLNLAVNAAQNEESAAMLMSATFSKVFELFDVGKPQAIKTVIHALDVLLAFATKCTTNQQPKPRDGNDDSQDYGDWPTFEEDGEEQAVAPTASTDMALQRFQEPLRHLLSNCFGSDMVPEDGLLLKIVDVWIVVAHVLITDGARNWNDYLDRFGIESWNSLRDTEQTKKYTPYYLASLVDKEPGIWSNHGPFLLSSWIGSLVERESLLKFQHRLTESLLNARCGSPILKNLPFWTKASTGRFQISAVEFSERRLSLISSVLSNIRVSLEETVRNSSTNIAQLRQEYKDLLKHMMTTMKHNYQELGNGSNMKGAYVDFVHRVIEFLQQHTSTICPVDRFFTDNGAFPLPATDPTYVVAQLKNYALRLHDPKTPKQVAVFLQSVSERAAVDGQQPYLVGQLQTAMSKVFEDGTSTRPTLRSFLVKAILPAYIETACTTVGNPCGWILALPYLQALQGVFEELLFDLDGTNPNSVAAVASMITFFLGSVRRALGTLLLATNLFQQAEILKLISACFLTIIALLTALDYVVRLSGPTKQALKHIEFFKGFAVYPLAQLLNGDISHNLERDDIVDQPYADTRNFATQELRDTLARNWKYDHQERQYYFTKGGSKREVVIDIGLFEEEKADLFKVFEDFFDCLGAMPALSDDDDDDGMSIRSRRNRAFGLDALEL